ncbi:polycomb group protein ASXL1 isoform X4 [Camelus dromedarius]|uniref:Polycomb group protein ASXL1 isoform X1 n=1 Tax=Camelus bactrianus TaxID=9837 RepID=A0AC58NZL2_CAMBA
MKDKQKRKKERTWAEAARLNHSIMLPNGKMYCGSEHQNFTAYLQKSSFKNMSTNVLENYSDAPMTPKQILQVIEAEGLKEMSGTSPLACLNAMLHSNSRGAEGLFYKLPGRISLFTLKKDALQWSRSPAAVEGEEPEDTADVESCGSNEASTVSGENDVSLDETSSNASCSTESQSRPLSNPRDSYRASSQANKQKKKTGVMLPRVVLTPLKVNGAHVESASGFSGRHADGESGSPSSSSSSGSLALGSAAIRGQAEVARDPAPLLRGFRKPATGPMKRNRGEEIDFETPGSILVNTNLRALINSRTFHALPSHFQQQLLCLLPEVDRQAGTDGLLRLSSSALNNEFFTHAAQSWRERLADGEFTHEMQVRIRQEMEKEKKVEQWKEKFFEDYYGQKLGLTKEESLKQNVGQGEAEIKSDLRVPGESTRPPRGPATRQRDGHFKKRSRPDLRTRARRNLYKKQEPEQAEVAKDTQSVAPDMPLYKDGEAEKDSAGAGGPHPPGTSSAAPDPESPEFPAETGASRIQSDPDDLARVSASPDRVLSLPQEAVDLEPKDQKRKSFEQAASASFPEKKPRLEDRQSFRNTIESVHTEKPQPTKEEPKVPPIRIQLSRIKPPWVVKGQPTYQICPRIIPITESSCRGWTGARTLADIKARALQVRGARGHHCHREAATTAIGGGGGPGGGGGGATDEGGGRDSSSGDGGEARGHPEPRGAPSTSGECASDLQRTQLLPPCPLNGEHTQAGVAVSRARREDLAPLRKEKSCPLQRVPDVLTSALEDTSPLPVAPTGDQPRQALPPLSSKTPAAERAAEQPVLHLDGRTECGFGTTSWEGDNEERGPTIPPENGPVQSLAGDVVLEEGTCQALDHGSSPTVKDPVTVTPSSIPKSSLAGCLQDRQFDDESGLGDSGPPSRESVTRQENLKTEALDSAGAAPWVPPLLSDKAVGRPDPDSRDDVPSVEPQVREEWEKDAPLVPALPMRLTAEDGLDPSGQLWTVPSQGCVDSTGSDCKQLEVEKLRINGDSEALSPHGESTDTASDFEGHLSEDSSEADLGEATVKKRSLVVERDEKQDWRCSASLSKVNGDLSLVTRTDGMVVPQSWVSRVCAVPQKIPDSLLLASTEYQPRPLSLGRPGSSVEATNPLVMQLLQGSLPLEKVLPPAHGDSKPKSPRLPLTKEQGRGGSLRMGCLQDPGGNSCRAGRSGPPSLRASKESLLPESCEASTDLATQAPGAPPKISKTVPSVDSLYPVTNPTAASGKVEVDSKEQFSLFSFEDRLEAHDLSQGSNSHAAPGNLTTSRAPGFSSPNVISSDPNQTGRALGDQNSARGQGKKLFGSKTEAAALQCPRPVEPTPLPAGAPPSFPSRKLGPSKNSVSGGVQTAREDWAPKPPPISVGSTKSEKTFGGGPLKANAENRNATGPGPRELVDHLQGMPFVLDLPFWKLPREPGKGLTQPLEPSSIPSQLNIKQAFYGKLSKLQLSSTSFNYSSSSPTFPKGLAGSVVQLSHKANFGASHSASLSLQMFTDSSTVESISLQCACSLKAMIMCQGCGAFCHDDCIGPSKLCVLCLVVR